MTHISLQAHLHTVAKENAGAIRGKVAQEAPKEDKP